MTTVFDEPIRLLTDDLAYLHQQLDRLIVLLAHDPSIDSMQRVHNSIARGTVSNLISDIDNALGEDGE